MLSTGCRPGFSMSSRNPISLRSGIRRPLWAKAVQVTPRPPPNESRPSFDEGYGGFLPGFGNSGSAVYGALSTIGSTDGWPSSRPGHTMLTGSSTRISSHGCAMQIGGYGKAAAASSRVKAAVWAVSATSAANGVVDGIFIGFVSLVDVVTITKIAHRNSRIRITPTRSRDPCRGSGRR